MTRRICSFIECFKHHQVRRILDRAWFINGLFRQGLINFYVRVDRKQVTSLDIQSSSWNLYKRVYIVLYSRSNFSNVSIFMVERWKWCCKGMYSRHVSLFLLDRSITFAVDGWIETRKRLNTCDNVQVDYYYNKSSNMCLYWSPTQNDLSASFVPTLHTSTRFCLCSQQINMNACHELEFLFVYSLLSFDIYVTFGLVFNTFSDTQVSFSDCNQTNGSASNLSYGPQTIIDPRENSSNLMPSLVKSRRWKCTKDNWSSSFVIAIRISRVQTIELWIQTCYLSKFTKSTSE